MVKLKICGMRRSEDIEMANRHKTDYIGFVFAESPRKVSFEQAKELSELLSDEIVPVGVFVNEHMKLIVDLFKDGIIEMAQLHGDEDEKYIRNLKDKSIEETGKQIINYGEKGETFEIKKFISKNCICISYNDTIGYINPKNCYPIQFDCYSSLKHQ